MSRARSARWLGVLGLGILGLGVVLVLLAGCGAAARDGDVNGEVELVAPGEDFLATLCFPGDHGLLRCGQRPIRAEESAEETAAVIVEALMAGPVAGARALPALPAEVGLLAVDIEGGVAYVDLTTLNPEAGNDGDAGPVRSAAVLERPAMGLREELLAVYGIVNSLTANSLGIDRVVLMWNGEQRPTFAGHVDTTRALMPDPSRNAEAQRNPEGP